MLQLGILMPRSTLYPSLGLDILSGLKQHLQQLNIFNDVIIVTDNIGFGVNEPEIYTKAEKMILVDDVDVVIVIADIRITEMLHPLFAASNKIMLVVNMGANFPDSWQPDSTTITHSLNFCFHAWLTGALAANTENKNAANVLSYYDAGYRQCYCMLNSNQTNGGVPAFNHITHLKIDEFTLQPLKQFLQENIETKTLLCQFAAEQAEKFYEEIESLQKEFQLDLFLSPMMFEESMINKISNKINIQSAHGYIPWHSTLSNKENILFNETIKTALKKEANYFTLLGWETGLIISAIYKLHKLDNNNAEEIIKNLTQIKFDSPRGFFKIDEASHHSYGSAYLASYKNSFDISLKNEKENIEAAWAKFKAETNIDADGSGWKNTYLCI